MFQLIDQIKAKFFFYLEADLRRLVYIKHTSADRHDRYVISDNVLTLTTVRIFISLHAVRTCKKTKGFESVMLIPDFFAFRTITHVSTNLHSLIAKIFKESLESTMLTSPV